MDWGAVRYALVKVEVQGATLIAVLLLSHASFIENTSRPVVL